LSDCEVLGSLGLAWLRGWDSRVVASGASVGLDGTCWASDFGFADSREQAVMSRHEHASQAIRMVALRRESRTDACDRSFIEADYGGHGRG
jgi:hypothetical protein